MSLMCNEILSFIEKKYPLSLAEEFDNTGLLIGSFNKEVNKILVCLEVNEAVAIEAVNSNVDMIVSHHPLIFKPLKSITSKDYTSSIIIKLIKNDINLYSMHTNFDNSFEGMNDILARRLKLCDVKVLSPNKNRNLYKLAVFVPVSHMEQVREAMLDSGGGYIGNYSHCSFSSLGKGSFMPLDGTSPFIGEAHKMEFVDEIKVETIVDGEKLGSVIAAMLKAHPYEEVAYDIYELENKIICGTGRIGELNKALDFKEFCSFVKKSLNISSLNVSGRMDRIIKRVGIVGGAGDDFIMDCINNNCDVLVTGDIKHHIAYDAFEQGLNIIDAGHYNTEIVFVPFIADFIRKGLGIECIESEVITNPIRTL